MACFITTPVLQRPLGGPSASVDSASNKRNADELEQQRHDPAPHGADESHLKKAKTDEHHQAQGPSRVLHVRNLPLDVAESELAALCQPFGQVQNILPLKGKSQAFVQLDTPQAAAALLQYYSGVQATLRGKSIYFQYSNRDSITVQQQVETPKPILLVTITNLLYPVTIEVLYGVFSKYGTVAKIVIFSKTAAFQALIQYVDVNSAVNAKSALDGQNLYVGACTLRVQYSQLPQLNVKYNNDKSRDFLDPNLPQGPPGGQPPQPPQAGYPPAYGAYPGYAPQGYGDPSAMYHMGGGQPGMHGMGGTVLIVSNLNPDRVTPDNLFTLFGNYGDVQRVKVLYNKKDNALVQLSTPEQAQAALVHLNNCPFLGKNINVNMSKHQFVALPRPGIEQESAHLTKDYSNSPFHRFRSPKNAAHICTPGQVLHIAGLPQGYTEESLRHVFATWRPQKIKFLPKDPKQALVQFDSVADAVEALISMHLQQMDGTTIRVSFSKATL